MTVDRHPTRLETKRLLLEPLRVEHAALLFEGLRDAELYRFIPTNPPATPDELAARYARQLAGPAATDERWWNWAAFTREGDRNPVGTVEVTLADDGRRAFLAYLFVRPCWGRGFATEACARVIAHLRAETSIRAVCAIIDTRNARSIALVERLGLVREETIEGADYFKGLPSDEYRYRLALMKDSDAEDQPG